MSEIDQDRSYKLMGIIVFCTLMLVAVIAGLKFMGGTDEEPEPPATETQNRGSVVLPPVLDYNRMEEDEAFQSLMQKRKDAFGIDQGIDLILQSDESVKIGDLTVSIKEIEEKIRLKTGDVIENDLDDPQSLETTGPAKADAHSDQSTVPRGAVSAPAVEKQRLQAKNTQGEGPQKKVRAYGIHIVNKGDNIWNIHYNFIKHYFSQRHISVEPLADESDSQGSSSGIGRILKFSENMVHIYNLREKKLDVDLNVIHPLTKIVVFNMQQVFALLDQVDYTYVNRIEFDGETIWIPSAQVSDQQ